MFDSKPLRNQNKINCMLTMKAELIMLLALPRLKLTLLW